jgi:hypothetical protein
MLFAKVFFRSTPYLLMYDPKRNSLWSNGNGCVHHQTMMHASHPILLWQDDVYHTVKVSIIAVVYYLYGTERFKLLTGLEMNAGSKRIFTR